MTTPPNAPEVDVLALLTPSEGEIIEPSMWEYSRTVSRKNTTVDVSDEVFLMRQSAMVHCYTHILRCMGDRPRVALLPADDLDEARTAVAALLTREAALAAEHAAKDRWISHLESFIGPSAMPSLRKSFDEGRAAGGANLARAEAGHG